MRNERDQWRDQALANKQEVEKLRGVHSQCPVITFPHTALVLAFEEMRTLHASGQQICIQNWEMRTNEKKWETNDAF